MKLTLKAARVNAGFTVKEAAEAIGVKEDTLYRWEAWKSSPKISPAVKLAKLYGLTVDDIDFGEA